MNVRAMFQITSLFALAVAACGPAGEFVVQGNATAGTTPPPAATPTTPTPATPTPAPTQAVVEPDVPSGGAAARDMFLAGTATSIVEAFSNSSPMATPDGKTLIFRSNRDGIPQWYKAEADKPESAAVRIMQTTERAGDAVVVPDGKTLLFLADKGADENFSIFKIGLDGSGLTELTKGETLHRDTPVIPKDTPTTMFYSAREVKSKTSRVYMQPIADGSSPKLIHTDPSTAFLTDVSPDGKWAVLVRLHSLSDSKVVLVDVSAGTAKSIYPAEGKTEYATNAAFSSDGSRIFVAADGGGEQALLLALDTKTSAEKARYTETKPKSGRIDDFAVAKTGDSLALLINAGNHSQIRLLNAKTLKPTAAVTMPLGTGGGLKFRDDGKVLMTYWSTPKVPWDLYTIDTKTGKSSAARKESRPTLDKLPDLEASITEVTSADGTKVPVNLYLPKPNPNKKLPVMVIVHGGPAGSYAVRWSAFTRFYSSQGFVIVEPNVRGSTGFGRAYEQADDYKNRMNSVNDMEAVGKWAITQPWADPERLVLLGGSYGGYMTLMGVSRHPTLWKAGVDVFGIYNWNTFMKSTTGAIRDIFQKEIGPESDTAFLDTISPSSAVDKIVAPLFVYAGQNDPRVPRSESDQIVASLRTRKVPVEYMVAANEGHSLDRKENITAFLARSMRFLEFNVLKKK